MMQMISQEQSHHLPSNELGREAKVKKKSTPITSHNFVSHLRKYEQKKAVQLASTRRKVDFIEKNKKDLS